jgi:molybdopterin-guanine dinucleotide biosynthesis protein A
MLDPIDGLVLAGGRSQRFGSDKRLARVGGQELVRRAVSKVLRAVSGTVFVATGTRAERLPGTARAIVIRDAPPNRGPLGGIAAGLERTTVGIVVLACDLPFVRPQTLHAVAASGRRAGRPAAVRRLAGWEPLVAYYPRSVLKDVRAAIHQGALAPHRLLEKLGAVPVAANDDEEFRNINTTADLEDIGAGRARRSTT